jgi:hypothetical protein
MSAHSPSFTQPREQEQDAYKQPIPRFSGDSVGIHKSYVRDKNAGQLLRVIAARHGLQLTVY